MDLSVLKKRPSFPFETIAVAVAFSPRLEGLLYETRRIAQLYSASVVVIHIGKKEAEDEERLEKLIVKSGLSRVKNRLIWMDGEPVETILRLCKLNVVDLLIIGALEKENLYKFYVGGIARKISRRAKCSVLLLTHPSVNPKRFQKIVVNATDNLKTIHTLKTIRYMSGLEKIGVVHVVHEANLPVLNMTVTELATEPEVIRLKRELFEEEHARLKEQVSSVSNESHAFQLETVYGKPGYAISEYARQQKADLLVFNSPDTHLGLFDRIFTHDIEYVLADLPCNLLIVHSRV